MFYLYPILVIRSGKSLKETFNDLESVNNLLSDAGARVRPDRISVCLCYDKKEDPYVLVERNRLEESLDLLEDFGVEISDRTPLRILKSPLQLSHFLGYKA
ncbi:MAG: hypothetical protein ISS82_01295 [Nanoarchaeota archaeon]|nr:hypothetical protein [Nanoarchaeota archaeon]